MSSASILRSLSRLGHVWVENPVSLILFSSRMIRALPYLFEEIGASAWTVISRILHQTWKTVLRSALPVAAVGVAASLGLSAVLAQAGPIVLQFVYLVVLPFLAANVLPLLVALLIIGRSGASIAAKFAAYPAVKGRQFIQYDRRTLQRLILPFLVANTIGGALFYLVLVVLVVGAGTGITVQTQGFAKDALDSIRANETMIRALFTGTVKSALFGGIIAFIAAAFGVQAAERFVSDQEETHDLHYAVWESSVTSFIVCTAMTVGIGSLMKP